MNSFSIGKTVTRKGTEIHGLIIDTWTNKHGLPMLTIVTGYKHIPIAIEARECIPYVVQSPDTVMVIDDWGQHWFFEVMDVTGDGLSVFIMTDEGLWICPIAEVTRIIPASIARLAQLIGGAS